MHDPAATKSLRQHDLDALRAFAMLLGIGLHAALSFSGFPWIVQDRQTNPAFLLLFAAVHGFRMPLFILISGYFTMMLWRQRGLKALLKQRLVRVFIPCVLGLLTIIPFLHWASGWAMRQSATQDAERLSNLGPQGQLIESIRRHDLDAVGAALAAGADAKVVDPDFKVTPLGWAALLGDVPIARLLLEKGADVKTLDKDGYEFTHFAAFMGQPDMLAFLVEKGGDPLARSKGGLLPSGSAKADMSFTAMVTTAMRIPMPEKDVLNARRAQCLQFLAKYAPAAEETVSEPKADAGGLARMRAAYLSFLTSERFKIQRGTDSEPFNLMLTDVFGHLWFLWILCWLVAFFGLVALFAEHSNVGRVPGWVTLSPLALVGWIGLSMLPQLFMGVMIPGFGPDTAVGLIPQPHVLVYYSLFFAFGAFYYDSNDRDGQLGRPWWLAQTVATCALPVGLAMSGQIVISALAQLIYAWTMSLSLIALFRKVIRKESRTIRYLSDSAYWLYLMHLPLVIMAQAWVRPWEWPAIVKFLFICVSVTAVLLISYQLLVRYTVIGLLLNGRRVRMSKEIVA